MGVKFKKKKGPPKYRHKPRWFQLFTSGAGTETLDRTDLSIRTLVLWATQYALHLGGHQGLAFLGKAIRTLSPRLEASARSDILGDREEAAWLRRGLDRTRAQLQRALSAEDPSNDGADGVGSVAMLREGDRPAIATPGQVRFHPRCLMISKPVPGEPWWKKVGRDW